MNETITLLVMLFLIIVAMIGFVIITKNSVK